MTELEKFNSGDNETLYGFYGSEVAYLKMLMYMIENGSELGKYTDLEKLRCDLERKQNDYSVYLNY